MRAGIKEACDALAHDPRPRGVKKLSPGHMNKYRVRAPHNYRITYMIDDQTNTVEIIEILHRGQAYRRRS